MNLETLHKRIMKYIFTVPYEIRIRDKTYNKLVRLADKLAKELNK